MSTPTLPYTPPAALRTPTVLYRGRFTDSLIVLVRSKLAAPVLLGDGEAPKEAGWVGDQPGKGQFVPYLVLKTGPGNPNPIPDTLARRTGNAWRLIYQLSFAGGDRSQAEHAGDAGRHILAGLHDYLITDGHRDYKVLKSEVTAMGPVNRNDTPDPPLYEGADTVELWIDKH